jgi:hypothetical protein
MNTPMVNFRIAAPMTPANQRAIAENPAKFLAQQVGVTVSPAIADAFKREVLAAQNMGILPAKQTISQKVQATVMNAKNSFLDNMANPRRG